MLQNNSHTHIYPHHLNPKHILTQRQAADQDMWDKSKAWFISLGSGGV